MNFIHFLAERAAVRMESRDAKKGKRTYVWDADTIPAPLGQVALLWSIFRYIFPGVPNQTQSVV